MIFKNLNKKIEYFSQNGSVLVLTRKLLHTFTVSLDDTFKKGTESHF